MSYKVSTNTFLKKVVFHNQAFLYARLKERRSAKGMTWHLNWFLIMLKYGKAQKRLASLKGIKINKQS